MVPCEEGQRCGLALSRQRLSPSLDTRRCTEPYFSAHTVCSVPSPHRGGNRKREEDFSGLLRTLGRVI